MHVTDGLGEGRQMGGSWEESGLAGDPITGVASVEGPGLGAGD